MQNLRQILCSIFVYWKNRETHLRYTDNIEHCDQTKWQIALELHFSIKDSGANLTSKRFLTISLSGLLKWSIPGTFLTECIFDSKIVHIHMQYIYIAHTNSVDHTNNPLSENANSTLDNRFDEYFCLLSDWELYFYWSEVNLCKKFAQEAYGHAEIVSFYWPFAMLDTWKTFARTKFCQYDWLSGFWRRIWHSKFDDYWCITLYSDLYSNK